MSDKLNVRPGDGLKVRRPHTEGGQLLPDGGMEVPNTEYWRRRLLSKDVILCEGAETDVAIADEPADHHEEE